MPIDAPTIEFTGNTVVSGLLAIALWLLRGKISIWDKHVEDCEEIPKALILTKLDGLSASLNDLKTGVADVKADLQRQIDRVDGSYHDFKEMITGHLLKERR